MGSCRHGERCSKVHSHYQEQPTWWYLERMEVFRRFSVPVDARGDFHPEWMQPGAPHGSRHAALDSNDARHHQQQLQQAGEQWPCRHQEQQQPCRQEDAVHPRPAWQQQQHITAMAAADDGSGSHTITFTVSSGPAAAAGAAAAVVPSDGPTVKQEQQPDACQLPAYAAAALAAATAPVDKPSPFAVTAMADGAAAGQELHQLASPGAVTGAAAAAAAVGRCGSAGNAPLSLPQTGSSHTAGGVAAGAAAAESAEDGPQGTSSTAAAGSLATSNALPDNSQPPAAAAAVAGGAARSAAAWASMPVSGLLAELGFPQLSCLFEDEMVSTVGVLALMTRQDYTDLEVPKGASLAIMAACKQLTGQQ
ncbi:hypothetical protein COO60DRAFT_68351 [Scenedesmus sp. NREL 46B-D3]|nr:hypothetical protein COO60DRAFT_68351 [Scenedesmus sp. NREL 46B-D3]